MENKSLTIVMTYWNRKIQLLNTLKSIPPNTKIIIVDDASNDGDDITYLENDFIKVVTLKNKTWINPCIAWNAGFAAVSDSDIVIFQNCECIHIGNIVEHAINNARDGVYLNYSALSVDQPAVDKITSGENIIDVIQPIINLRRRVVSWGGDGWYNHPIYRPEMMNFCSGITYKDLYDMGGFDERYQDGLGYDDNEFLCRIRKKKMDIQFFETPFVVHQHHCPFPFNAKEIEELMKINEARLHATQAAGTYDVKSYNKLFK
jgi:glycosyltransferase involved in cell wall biosynthesis